MVSLLFRNLFSKKLHSRMISGHDTFTRTVSMLLPHTLQPDREGEGIAGCQYGLAFPGK